MFSVTISGAGPNQIYEEALKVAAFFAPTAPLKGEVIVPEKPAPAEPVQTDIEEVTNAPATHDDMVAALSKVNGDRGMQAVRDIIVKFGAQKVGEVKAEDRAAVIAAAKAIIE